MAGTKPSTGETRLAAIVQAIRELFEGRSHAIGSFTLTANAASTTVSALNCGVKSVILLSPRTANAAAEIGNGTIYIASGNIKNKQFVVTHANNAQADRTYDYAIQG